MNATTAASLVTLMIVTLFVSLHASMWGVWWLLRRDISVLQENVQEVFRKSGSLLPEVGGFTSYEVFQGLAAAARLELEEQEYKTAGRPRSFSRRTMNNWLGWSDTTFEMFCNDMEKQGYLTRHGEKRSIQWTPEGKLLLRQVLSGRFSSLYGEGKPYTIDVC